MNTYKGARRGKFFPKNQHKWVDSNNIQFRSGIEQKFFALFDLSPSVISIASEKVIIPYFDEARQKQRKYYVDLIVKFKDKQGNIQVKLIEIKSYSESIPPKKPKRLTEAYNNKVATWITNQSKWRAATKFAKQRGYDFVVLSDRDL